MKLFISIKCINKKEGLIIMNDVGSIRPLVIDGRQGDR